MPWPLLGAGLWSLWDVLKESAEAYVYLGECIHDAEVIYALDENVTVDELDRPILSAVEAAAMKPELQRILAVAKKLKLPVSMRLLGKRLGNDEMPKTETEFRVLCEVLKEELDTRLFLFVPQHRARYYEREKVMNDATRAAFPLATQEMREAGNAYALALPTAAVFHCMRALEHGLRALATDLGKVFDIQQWQNIIDEIESAIDAQAKALPRGAAKNARLQFLGEAAKEFTYFKDGWRNYVSHGKATYGERQALTVMNHTRDFLERLSPELHE